MEFIIRGTKFYRDPQTQSRGELQAMKKLFFPKSMHLLTRVDVCEERAIIWYKSQHCSIYILEIGLV